MSSRDERCNCRACRQQWERAYHRHACDCALCRTKARTQQFVHDVVAVQGDPTARKQLEDVYIRDQLHNIAEMVAGLSSHERRPTYVNVMALPVAQRNDYIESRQWWAAGFKGGTLIDDNGGMLVKRLRQGGVAFGHPETGRYEVFHTRADEHQDPIGAWFVDVAVIALGSNPIMVTSYWPKNDREFKCRRS